MDELKRYMNVNVPLAEDDTLYIKEHEEPEERIEEPEILGDLSMTEILRELRRQDKEDKGM